MRETDPGSAGLLFRTSRMRTLSRLAIAAVGVLLLPAVYGAVSGFLDCHNDVLEWAAPGAVEKEQLVEFEKRFGAREAIVVSWEGATLGDARLGEFVSHLNRSDQAGHFHRVSSTAQLLEELQSSPLSLSPREAGARLTPWALSRDGALPWVLASLSETGIDRRQDAVRAIHAAAGAAGIAVDALRMGGNGYWLAEFDRLCVESPLVVVPFILLAVLVGVWWFLGDLALTLLVTGIGSAAGAMTMGAVYWSGVPMNALLSPMPTLVFLIGVSNCLHMAKHFRTAEHDSGVEAMRASFKLCWRPTLYSGLTTGIGLASLTVSNTAPIRQFGVFGALGVAMVTAMALLVLPPLAARLPRSGPENPANAGRLWRRLHLTVVRLARPILLLSLVASVLLAAGVPRLRTGVSPETFFLPVSPQLDSLRWLEETFCGLESLELVVEFASDGPLRPVDELVQVSSLRRKLASVEGVNAVVAADLLTPRMTSSSRMRSIALRSQVNAYLEQNDQSLRNAGLLATSPETRSWRLSLRTSGFGDVRQVRRRVEAAVADHLGGVPAELSPKSWWLTGTTALFLKVESQFMRDLWLTFLIGLAAITVATIVLTGSAGLGLLAMIPNVIPTMYVLGICGWGGSVLEVGSIMTASVALGIAVDDTMHYLSFTRIGMDRGMSSLSASRQAMRDCGGPITLTSLVCGGGMLLYALCDFLPTRRFGVLLSSMLFAALLADLVVLPALLRVRLRRETPE